VIKNHYLNQFKIVDNKTSIFNSSSPKSHISKEDFNHITKEQKRYLLDSYTEFSETKDRYKDWAKFHLKSKMYINQQNSLELWHNPPVPKLEIKLPTSEAK